MQILNVSPISLHNTFGDHGSPTLVDPDLRPSMRVLNDVDCEFVDGGWGLPGAGFGGAMGGISYGISVAYGASNFSPGGLLTAIGAGAATGAIGGPMSVVRQVWTFNATVAGSTAHAITTM